MAEICVRYGFGLSASRNWVSFDAFYGDGSQTRSCCYYEDLVDGFLRMMASPDDVIGPINLGNPVEFTIKELAEQVIRLTGTKSKLAFEPLPNDDPTQRKPDISKARNILGWEPEVKLQEGLIQTIEYFKNFVR